MKYSLGLILFVVVYFAGITTASSQKKGRKKVAEKSLKGNDKSLQKFQFAYGEALRYKMAKDITNAEMYFRECIKLNPDEPAPYYEISNIYHQLNQLPLALESAKKAAELDPTNYWYQMLYAESLQKTGQLQESINVIEQLSRLFPEKHELLMRLAMMHFLEEEYQEGIEILDEVEKKIGVVSEVIDPKKIAYIRLGEIDKAAVEMRKLIESDPENVSYYLDLVDLFRVNEKKDEALKVYKEMLVKFPKNGNIRLSLADFYHDEGDDKRAFKELKQAFRDEELDIDAKVKILLSYYGLINKSDEYKKEAFELNQVLLEVHPNEAKAHTIYGDFLYNDRDLEKARYHFGRAVELDERPFPIWNQLILIEAELVHYDSVLSICKRALELFPNQPSLYYFSGIANSELKNHEDAIQDFESGKKLVVSNRALLAQFHSSLAESYHELKKYKESDAAFEAALNIDSNNANTLNNYSYYLSLRLEKLEKAERMSARSNRLSPNQPSYLDTYAWIMYQLKRYEEAKEWIEKALQSGGDNSSEVLEHAGDIFYQLSEREKAVEYWEKAKKGNDGGSPLLDQKIRDQQLYE